MTGTGVPKDERRVLKCIHKSTVQGYQPAIDYCKEPIWNGEEYAGMVPAPTSAAPPVGTCG